MPANYDHLRRDRCNGCRRAFPLPALRFVAVGEHDGALLCPACWPARDRVVADRQLATLPLPFPEPAP
jgi:hypothetical protein